MNAQQLLASFTDEQREIISAKKVSARKRIDPMLEMLRPVGQFDLISDLARTRSGCLLVFSIFATFAMAILSANIPYIGLPLLIVVIVTAIYSGRRYMMLNKSDLSDNLRSVAVPIFTLLREDFDPQEPVATTMDLQPIAIAAKQVSKQELPKERLHGCKRIVETVYVDPWWTVDATMRDGTRIEWSLVDTLRRQDKTRFNGRKTKTKIKSRTRTRITVDVTMRKDTYAMPAIDDAKTKESDRKNRIRFVREVTRELGPVDPKAIVDAIAEVFRSVQPAKGGA